MESNGGFRQWGAAQALTVLAIVFGDEGRQMMPLWLWGVLILALFGSYIAMAGPYVLENFAAYKAPQLIVSDEHRRRSRAPVVILAISALMFAGLAFRVAWILKPDTPGISSGEVSRLTGERNDALADAREWNRKYDRLELEHTHLKSLLVAATEQRDEAVEQLDDRDRKAKLREDMAIWLIRISSFRQSLESSAPPPEEVYNSIRGEFLAFARENFDFGQKLLFVSFAGVNLGDPPPHFRGRTDGLASAWSIFRLWELRLQQALHGTE